ncbi:MAG: DUF883 C-terminal domain-containing protein [Oligoflexia bacterium]|nr:DUF883 C-terminal domain-containing protein [Oligoflexia bacterium]
MKNETVAEENGWSKKALKAGEEQLEAGGQAINKLADKAVNYADELGSRAAKVVKENGSKQIERMSSHVKDEPLRSMAIAAGAGILLGIFLRKIA